MRSEPVRNLPLLAAQAAAPTAAPEAPTSTTAEERATAFRPVEARELRSGEVLLVEAYAAIWLIAFGLILLSWRRQRRLDDRIASLESALARARRAQGGGGAEVESG